MVLFDRNDRAMEYIRMITAFLIMKGNHPSMNHARYLDEGLVQAEVERLENSRKETNERPRVTGGHGSCFLNVKDNEPWSYVKREFPE
jgi:hypothetical protein